jgi:uncharacterized repeat protein (TIGR03803 family)
MHLSRLSCPAEPSWGKSAYALLFLFVTTAIVLPAQTFTSLVSFNGNDGAFPASMSLVQGTDGNLYGTAPYGGANSGGTVFKVTPTGTVTTLYSFCTQINCTDGKTPLAGLVLGANGTFYGTTSVGGANDDGTVFSITPGGTLTTLHNFDSTDGANPAASLVQHTNGTFYGTTKYGGASGDGTVFSLSMGLHPFVETLPASGKVGSAVKILGTNLTCATSVTFNGTTASFTVVSSSEITTTVPAGATTGSVSVTTSKGTFKSNRKFRVTP